MITGVEAGNPAAQFSIERDGGGSTTFTAVEEFRSGESDGSRDDELRILSGVAEFFRLNPGSAELLRESGYDAFEEGSYCTSSSRVESRIVVTYPGLAKPPEDTSEGIVLAPFEGTKFTDWQAIRSLSSGGMLMAQNNEELDDTVGRYDVHDGTRHQAAWELALQALPDFGKTVRAKASDLVARQMDLPPFPDFYGYWDPETLEIVYAHDLVSRNVRLMMNLIDANLNLGVGILPRAMNNLPIDPTNAEREHTRSELLNGLSRFFSHFATIEDTNKRLITPDEAVDAEMLYEWAEKLTELAQ